MSTSSCVLLLGSLFVSLLLARPGIGVFKLFRWTAFPQIYGLAHSRKHFLLVLLDILLDHSLYIAASIEGIATQRKMDKKGSKDNGPLLSLLKITPILDLDVRLIRVCHVTPMCIRLFNCTSWDSAYKLTSRSYYRLFPRIQAGCRISAGGRAWHTVLIESDRSPPSARHLVCVMKLSIFWLPYFRLPISTYHWPFNKRAYCLCEIQIMLPSVSHNVDVLIQAGPWIQDGGLT